MSCDDTTGYPFCTRSTEKILMGKTIMHISFCVNRNMILSLQMNNLNPCEEAVKRNKQHKYIKTHAENNLRLCFQINERCCLSCAPSEGADSTYPSLTHSPKHLPSRKLQLYMLDESFTDQTVLAYANLRMRRAE